MLSCRTKIIERIEFQIINLRKGKIGKNFQTINQIKLYPSVLLKDNPF